MKANRNICEKCPQYQTADNNRTPLNDIEYCYISEHSGYITPKNILWQELPDKCSYKAEQIILGQLNAN